MYSNSFRVIVIGALVWCWVGTDLRGGYPGAENRGDQADGTGALPQAGYSDFLPSTHPLRGLYI